MEASRYPRKAKRPRVVINSEFVRLDDLHYND